MRHIFEKHKKFCIIFSAILSLGLLVLYLYAALLPGVWHQNTFLCRRPDGSFSGKNSHSEYEMTISRKDASSDVSFRVNETVRNYRIVSDTTTHSVEIFENGTSVFKGQAVGRGDALMLIDDNEGFIDFTVTATTSNDIFSVPADDEQFPSYTSLYNRAIKNSTDTRGNILVLLPLAIIILFLIIDIRYPDLFFHLKYMWHVDGGSPSEFYRFGQKLGRIISVIAIFALLIATFAIH